MVTTRNIIKTPVISVEHLNPEQLNYLLTIMDNLNRNRNNIVAFSIRPYKKLVYLFGELTINIYKTEYHCKSYDEFINLYQCLKLEQLL